MTILPQDSSVEAEYEDGYILNETEHEDISPWDNKYNIFRAILDKHPQELHGPMVRFSVFWENRRYDVDWVGLPDNARPIRFRDGFLTRNMATGHITKGWSGVSFGYQYNDENGKNVKVVDSLN